MAPSPSTSHPHYDRLIAAGEPIANPDRALIISRQARTPGPSSITSRASPSSSAGTNPSPKIVPSARFAHHPARRYAHSIPTYCIRAP